jgi:hypothetical protein
MPTLDKVLRDKLEKAVLAARAEAEKGAESAMLALGVADGKKPAHLDKDGEDLRRRLRARGRQAGDVRRADESQDIAHLVQECGYEHWHRMLFARFLAENELLRHPEMGVAVSLEECDELAQEEGLDRWELASRFAQHMLPQVFRQDDPVLHVKLPSEARTELTKILNRLPTEVFTADDSLGWTYQFWQKKRKELINKSNAPRGADEIPAVTQLFTEDYMVEFLLHNTFGAWWAGKLGTIVAATEEEARARAALPARNGLPGITWSYLRFVQSAETKTWKPAAGTFDGWPKAAKDITFLDPCMGSGHFPAFAIPILARLRMEEEGLDAAEAANVVLRDNIYGLELDPRCAQIGAFNLALTAWKLSGYQILPSLHVACCGLAPNADEADWLAIAGDNENLQRGMKRLYRLFKAAAVLGSLINPRSGEGDLLVAAFHELQPLLDRALAREAQNDSEREMAVTARGLAKAAEILASQFSLVATNVPYLGFGKQDEILQVFCTDFHPDAKADLATCFLERCLSACSPGGVMACVTPQNWLFLNDYKSVRKKFLIQHEWLFALRLGPGAFETITGEVVKASLVAMSKRNPNKDGEFFANDISGSIAIREKVHELKCGDFNRLSQAGQLKNPNWVVTSESLTHGKLLQKFATAYEGAKTVDIDRFRHFFWELPRVQEPQWWFHNSSPTGEGLISGCHYVSANRSDGSEFQKNIEVYERSGRKVVAWTCGSPCWNKMGVAVAWMSNLPASLYVGTVFDNSAAVILPESVQLLPALYCFVTSGEYTREVRKINQKVQVAAGTLDQVPFDLTHWQKVAAERYPNGLPKPFSNDPTQWLFNGHPSGSDQPLHVAVARLLGYRWPRQTGSSFTDCPPLAPDGLETHADDDGIVCLSSLRGEANASDRLRALLVAALGQFDESRLVASAGRKGSKSKSLEDWLRDEFFEQHCDLFHQRPFVWHLWDGRKDGFHALVNYHKLASPDGAGRRALESLTYGYLGDWILRQRDSVTRGEGGAEDRLAAALELKEGLERIIAGEPPYDLFIRWKPLHQLPIGWEPDVNDGVRLNARPFLTVTLSRGKKDAGLFRSKPNIKWDKAKGNEPLRSEQDYPWYWNWDGETLDFMGGGKEPDGNRWNDCHYSTACKQAARERLTKKGAAT